MVKLNNDWDSSLAEEFQKEYYVNLRAFLKEEYRSKTIYPAMDNIFNALRYTAYNDVKVVIVGQDPYINPGEAHGLSFSVQPEARIPPSLHNIFKELAEDESCFMPDNGCLIPWAKQGVMMLNAVLTVERGRSRSHAGRGWETFTNRVLGILNDREQPIVFLLWGRDAQAKGACIDAPRHLVLTAAHPSPLAGGRFFGCKHFSKANEFLQRQGQVKIDWQIPLLKGRELTMDKRDGMNYAPQGVKKTHVVEKGEFIFAVTALDHGHIYGMTGALLDAGGVCSYVFDPDPDKMAHFIKLYPETHQAVSLEAILDDPSVHMIAAAGIPNTRGPLGVRVMDAGKDYFVDKTPFTTLAQLEDAKAACARTGRKYMVYYSERLHCECGIYAGQLIESGAIGKVIQVLGTGPHRLNAASRPDWFFNREQYGGILCDIGSHQIEQFLYYANAKDAAVKYSQAGNYNHPEYPELEDFGDASLIADNGALNYFRVDWFTPEALPTWGDGRLFILGTKGTIELRKYINPGISDSGGHVYLCNDEVDTYINVSGKVGCPFFGEMILDCLNRTENAMTQAHTFKAAELCLNAQAQAVRVC